MEKFKELKRNTIIITIANFGNKLISLILAPLYSYYMTTAEYGTMDLIITTVSLIMPILSLNIYEATFRFSSESDVDKKSVLSTCSIVGIISTVLLVIFMIVASFFSILNYLILYTCYFIILDMFFNIFTQFLRGNGRIKQYAFSGVISSVFNLILNLLFLLGLNKGLEGWLISFLLSKVAVLIYLIFATDIRNNFSLKSFDAKLFNKFMKFCIPLISTTIMWWIMNASDRYAISMLLGVSYNGIYAVSNKIPSILSTFESIFYQAWQISAVNSYDDKKKNKFYSTAFNSYLFIMLIGLTGLLLIIKPMILVLFDSNYQIAWYYVTPLLVAVLFHALSGFLGTFYTAAKETRGAVLTTAAGAFTNIVLNFMLIPIFGIMAAACTTLLGYILTFICRWYDTKKYVAIKLEWNKITLFSLIVILQLILYYIPGVFSYTLRAIILIIILIMNRKSLLSLIKR